MPHIKKALDELNEQIHHALRQTGHGKWIVKLVQTGSSHYYVEVEGGVSRRYRLNEEDLRERPSETA